MLFFPPQMLQEFLFVHELNKLRHGGTRTWPSAIILSLQETMAKPFLILMLGTFRPIFARQFYCDVSTVFYLAQVSIRDPAGRRCLEGDYLFAAFVGRLCGAINTLSLRHVHPWGRTQISLRGHSWTSEGVKGRTLQLGAYSSIANKRW